MDVWFLGLEFNWFKGIKYVISNATLGFSQLSQFINLNVFLLLSAFEFSS